MYQAAVNGSRLMLFVSSFFMPLNIF